ncbi:MAG: DUF2958 domain-containing protein [Pyrinomonadaceae bacterium]
MRELLPPELKRQIPKLYSQDSSADPIVYAKFSFPASGWLWFVTEGQTTGRDFTFFGYVIGYEAEWGYFMLGELEQVNVNGLVIERDDDFKQQTLSNYLSGST